MKHPDLFDATRLRDAALERVSINSGSWIDLALRAVAIHMHGEFTGEEMRMSLSKIVEQPHHHNAWGALVSVAMKKGIIAKTGRYKNMMTQKSHARSTPILRKMS